jgi:hypothetical protein
MARALIADFGHPDDVAARYGDVRAGLMVIPPEQARAFLTAATIGVAVQWAVGIAAMVTRIDADAAASTVWVDWLASGGIGALWWPGLMLVCAAAAAWIARRRSPHAAAEGATTGSLGLNWIGACVGLPLSVLCTAFMVAPGWVVAHIVPPGVDTTWAAYTGEFRALRLPALVVAMMANLGAVVITSIKGHESRVVRRLAIAVGLGGIAILTWCVVGGPIFVLQPADTIARGVLGLLVFFALIDLAKRAARELFVSRGEVAKC